MEQEEPVVSEVDLKMEVLEEVMVDAVRKMKAYAEKNEQMLTALHSRVVILETEMKNLKAAQSDLGEDFCRMADNLESVTEAIAECRDASRSEAMDTADPGTAVATESAPDSNPAPAPQIKDAARMPDVKEGPLVITKPAPLPVHQSTPKPAQKMGAGERFPAPPKELHQLLCPFLGTHVHHNDKLLPLQGAFVTYMVKIFGIESFADLDGNAKKIISSGEKNRIWAHDFCPPDIKSDFVGYMKERVKGVVRKEAAARRKGELRAGYDKRM